MRKMSTPTGKIRGGAVIMEMVLVLPLLAVVLALMFRFQTIVPGFCQDVSDSSVRAGATCGAACNGTTDCMTCVDETNCNASGTSGLGPATWVTQHSGS